MTVVRSEVFGVREMGRFEKHVGDRFMLRITGDDGRAVELHLTPEQWALALSGRAAVKADAEWRVPDAPAE